MVNRFLVSCMKQLMNCLTDNDKICIGIRTAQGFRGFMMAMNLMPIENFACDSALSILRRIQ